MSHFISDPLSRLSTIYERNPAVCVEDYEIGHVVKDFRGNRSIGSFSHEAGLPNHTGYKAQEDPAGVCIRSLRRFAEASAKRIQGWINIYPPLLNERGHTNSGLYEDRRHADESAPYNRVACIYIDVEEGDGI